MFGEVSTRSSSHLPESDRALAPLAVHMHLDRALGVEHVAYTEVEQFAVPQPGHELHREQGFIPWILRRIDHRHHVSLSWQEVTLGRPTTDFETPRHLKDED